MMKHIPHVVRLKAIKMLLTFACYKNFKLYQIDVKSKWIYMNGEVNVEQHLGFVNPRCEDQVFKLTKTLRSLKQAARAWCESLSNFLL